MLPNLRETIVTNNSQRRQWPVVMVLGPRNPKCCGNHHLPADTYLYMESPPNGCNSSVHEKGKLIVI